MKSLASKGLLEKELVKFYNKLMEDRTDADYSPIITFDEEAVRTLKEMASKFNSELIRLIDKESNI